MDRKGQTFVVTGGASGLGQGTAVALSAEGANIMILDMNDKLGEKLAADLPNAIFRKCDVTNEKMVKEAVDACVAKFGGVHGVVNCAGVGSATVTLGRKGVHSMGMFDWVTKINLYGTFNVARYCAEAMAKNEPDASD